MFYEALRMYRAYRNHFFFQAIPKLGYVAPLYVVLREATEDTVLAIPKPVGQDGTFSVPVPKGTYVSPSLGFCQI